MADDLGSTGFGKPACDDDCTGGSLQGDRAPRQRINRPGALRTVPEISLTPTLPLEVLSWPSATYQLNSQMSHSLLTSGYLVDSSDPNPLGFGLTSEDLLELNRFHSDCLLDETEEKLSARAGGSAVEAEREFVQVVI